MQVSKHYHLEDGMGQSNPPEETEKNVKRAVKEQTARQGQNEDDGTTAEAIRRLLEEGE